MNAHKVFMKNRFLLLLACLFATLSANAKITNEQPESPFIYYNSFKEACVRDASYSMECIRALAADPDWGAKLLPELLHSFFFRHIASLGEIRQTSSVTGKEKKQFKLACTILDHMVADTCLLLSSNAAPIQYWVNACLRSKDAGYLNNLVRDYIDTQLATDNIYHGRTGRYALLIRQILAKDRMHDKIALELLTAVQNKAEPNTRNQTDNRIYSQSEQRAYHRYLYAYCNYIESEQFIHDNYINRAKDSLKRAFDFSPNDSDKLNYSGYHDEMEALGINDTDYFKLQYIDFLDTYAFDRDTILSARLAMALENPEKYKPSLEMFYMDRFEDGAAFPEFWIDQINRVGKEAPIFSFVKNDGSLFTQAGNPGKWIFLDFWGLWCAPCIHEHPEMEAFYQNTVLQNQDKLTMYTMDCRDSREQVDEHMRRHNYTFPVAMEDLAVLNMFRVKNWPTKILITPEGKYVEIPSGANWAKFITGYAGINDNLSDQ